MPGTLLLDDYRQSVQDQLQQHAQQAIQTVQQAVQPIQQAVAPPQLSVPTPPAPDLGAVQNQLSQYVQQLQPPPSAPINLAAPQPQPGAGVIPLGDVAQQLQDYAAEKAQGVIRLGQPQTPPVLGPVAQPDQTTGQVVLGGTAPSRPAPSTAPQPMSGGGIDATNPTTFAQTMAPYAAEAARQLGLPVDQGAAWITAMAAHETGFGKALPDPGSNNFFGIKAHPGVKSGASVATTEGAGGAAHTEQANFAVFDTPMDAIKDYVGVITRNQPQAVGAQTLEAFNAGLKAGGYYTADPQQYLHNLQSLTAQVKPTVDATLANVQQAVAGGAAPTTAAPAGPPTIIQKPLDPSRYGYGDVTPRNGLPIKFIVNHVANGPDGSLFDTYQKQAENTHYWVGKDGTIEQYVPDDQAAYGAGTIGANSNPPPDFPGNGQDYNRESINIEREGQPNETPTAAQWASLVKLNTFLAQKYNVPMDGDHIVGHYRTDLDSRAQDPATDAQAYMDRLVGDVKSSATAPAPALPATTPASNLAVTPASRAVAGDSTAMSQSQFGDSQLTTAEAYSACGPAAAVRFAEKMGRNPTLREATDMAAQVGWTQGQGMAGIQSEQKLMTNLGVPTHVVQGPQWDQFAAEAQSGNPVTISTSAHYFYADGYDPSSGAFHVGRSGLDLVGGKEWMTPAEMQAQAQRLGGGEVQGALFADNPTVPGASQAQTASNSQGFTMGGNEPADLRTTTPQRGRPPLVSPTPSTTLVQPQLPDITGGATQLLGGVQQAVGGALGQVEPNAQAAVQASQQAAQNAITAAQAQVDQARRAADQARQAAQQTVTPVLGAAQQAPQQVQNVTQQVLGGAQQGLGAASQAVQSTVKDIQQAGGQAVPPAPAGGYTVPTTLGQAQAQRQQQNLAEPAVRAGADVGAQTVQNALAPRLTGVLPEPVRQFVASNLGLLTPEGRAAEAQTTQLANSATTKLLDRRPITPEEQDALNQVALIYGGAVSPLEPRLPGGTAGAPAGGAVNIFRPESGEVAGWQIHDIPTSARAGLVADLNAAGVGHQVLGDGTIRVNALPTANANYEQAIAEAVQTAGAKIRTVNGIVHELSPAEYQPTVSQPGQGLGAAEQRAVPGPQQRVVRPGVGAGAEGLAESEPALGFRAPGAQGGEPAAGLTAAGTAGGAAEQVRGAGNRAAGATGVIRDFLSGEGSETGSANVGAMLNFGSAVGGGLAGALTTPTEEGEDPNTVLRDRVLRALGGAGVGLALTSGARFRGPIAQGELESIRAGGLGPTTRVPPRPAPNTPAYQQWLTNTGPWAPQAAHGPIAQAVDITKQSILSNPATHIANVIGNTLELLRQPLALAAGGRGDDALAGLVSVARGTPEAARNAISALRGNALPTLGGGAGSVIPARAPIFRALSAADAFTRTLGEYQGMAAEANRMLRDAGISPHDPAAAQYLANHARDIQAAGAQGGAQSVFARIRGAPEGETFLDHIFGNFSRAKDGLLASPRLRDQALGALLDLSIPFSGVPVQMLKIGANRLPVAAQVSGGLRMLGDLRAGNMAQFQRHLGETMVESTIQLMIAKQIADGNITGADDPDHPESVNVPGLGWMSMNEFGSYALPMRIMASWANGYEKGGQNIQPGTPEWQAALDRHGAALNAAIKPLAQGVPGENLIRMLANMEQGGLGQAALGVGQDVVNRVASPGALRFVNNVLDPVARDVDRKGVDSLWKQPASAIPGLANLVPPKIDPTTGEVLGKTRTGLGTLVGVQQTTSSPITREIARLKQAGYTKLSQPSASGTLSIDGSTVRLSQDEQRQVTQITGKTLGSFADKVESPGYQNSSDDRKAQLMQSYLNAAQKSDAKAALQVLGRPELNRRIVAGRNVVGQLNVQGGGSGGILPEDFSFDPTSGLSALEQRRQQLTGAAA